MKFNKVFLVFSFGILFPIFAFSDNVTYYKSIIEEQISKAENYEFRKNASQYKATNKQISGFGLYDFIIVGAGSTGTVLANRLSQVQKWKILLVEAGDYAKDVSQIPIMAPTVLQLSDYNWNYRSTPQKTACLDLVDQQCYYPRGRGIGGTTLLNGLMYVRGNKRDFDRWAEQGNPGWNYSEVLPYFKMSENFLKSDRDVLVDWDYHGIGGDLNVEYPIPQFPLTTNWLQANQEIGYNIVDYNGEEEIGAAVVQLNIKYGRRADGGNAFIKPIKDRPNLNIVTNSYVTRLIIKNKQTTGVEFTQNGQIYKALIKKEVILSAGVFGSVQILMLSGIGPEKHLKNVGIKPIQNLQVGLNLQDHPTFYGLSFNTNYTEEEKSLEDYVKEWLNGRGSLTAPHYMGGIGFYPTKLGLKNYPELELMFAPYDDFLTKTNEQLSEAKEKTWMHLKQSGTFSVFVIGLHPKSRGTVSLKSNIPFDYPLIDSNFLSDDENHDIDTLYEGIELVLNLTNTKAFARFNTTLIKQDLPACQNQEYLSKEYWYCLLRYFTFNVYHPVGTCRMGPDINEDVVDAEARVHGIGNLRVADASVFPFALSGHPNAPCVMIGEKVSDLIKKKYSKDIYRR